MISWGAPVLDGEEGNEQTRRRPRSLARTTARILAALVVGGVSGLVAMVGLLTLRSTVEGVVLHDLAEVAGWPLVPALAIPLALVVVAWRLRHRGFWRWMGLLVAGIVAGGLVGAGVGAVAGAGPSAAWAGAVMGAGALVLLTVVLALVSAFRSERSGMTLAAASLLLLALIAYG
ncbi:MAG TPA: hypothetical protein VK858_21195 [Longimicrobiales bacterium]|nr:hypothetical protein [Longimicrobiales bacterium]